jgi:coenzyme F420-0:L-glutamate ligase / coenzyme F420-1:gamma-L-glutamate ligase
MRDEVRMNSPTLTLTALAGLPLVNPGDDLALLLQAALQRANIVVKDGDVLVIAQKIVSKAEGRIINLNEVVPTVRASALAKEVEKDPRLVEVILSESTDVIRYRKGVLIVAHRLGFVMANAGIDRSNSGEEDELVILLPRDPDKSAAGLKAKIDDDCRANIGVIINDSFGRAWRNGIVGIALGAAGVPSLRTMVGIPDLFGHKLQVTEVAVADELAAAASLLMGQAAEGLPAVHVRGFACDAPPLPATALLRRKELDLFR